AVALLVSVISVNLLFFKDWARSDLQIPFIGTLGFALLILGANTVIHLLQKQVNKTNYKYAIIFSGLAVLYSTIAVFRGSFLDAAILNLASLVSTFIAPYFVIAQHIPFDSWLDILLSPLQAFRGWVKGGAESLNHFPKLSILGSKLKGAQGQLQYIIIGV